VMHSLYYMCWTGPVDFSVALNFQVTLTLTGGYRTFTRTTSTAVVVRNRCRQTDVRRAFKKGADILAPAVNSSVWIACLVEMM